MKLFRMKSGKKSRESIDFPHGKQGKCFEDFLFTQGKSRCFSLLSLREKVEKFPENFPQGNRERKLYILRIYSVSFSLTVMGVSRKSGYGCAAYPSFPYS